MEQMTIVLSKFESHDEETFQAQKEVWTEYSKEFSDATGVKYYWAHQEKEDGVYYIGVNLFPSKESRDSWVENYDVDAETAKFDQKMYEKTGKLDAVVMTTGQVKFGPFNDLSSSDYALGLNNKLMGQVNVVRIGLDYINDAGSFTLTSGILNQEPIYMGVSAAMVNGAVDGFVLGSAQELPRGIRINTVSPTVVTEALGKYDAYFPGFESVSVKSVANAYRKSIAGLMSGKVIKAGNTIAFLEGEILDKKKEISIFRTLRFWRSLVHLPETGGVHSRRSTESQPVWPITAVSIWMR